MRLFKTERPLISRSRSEFPRFQSKKLPGPQNSRDFWKDCVSPSLQKYLKSVPKRPRLSHLRIRREVEGRTPGARKRVPIASFMGIKNCLPPLHLANVVLFSGCARRARRFARFVSEFFFTCSVNVGLESTSGIGGATGAGVRDSPGSDGECRDW